MNGNFRYFCRRRTITNVVNEATASPSSNDPRMGGGSGGGPEDGSQFHAYDGKYAIVANQLELISRPPMPPTTPVPYVITLLAGGMGMDGQVEVRGSKGVRVTAGPPPLPETSSDSTNGVEVMTGELQNITIQRGLLPGVDQTIEMTPGNIKIDGGVGPVMIQSLTEITLSVAGGLSSITLTPTGIVIQGLLVNIN